MADEAAAYASASASASASATTRMNVAIETDVGHDCDDIEALQVALKDHKSGRTRIIYISTVSQNNVNRCSIVQFLCGLFGITDIPLIPSRREKATKSGNPLANCKQVYRYTRVGSQYCKNPDVVDVSDFFPDRRSLCRVLEQSQSVKLKQELLRQYTNVRVLVIGPGVEADTFLGLVHSTLPEAEQTRQVRRIVDRVVFQGNFNDQASFNIGCDFEPVAQIQQWTARHGVRHYNIGKLVAYNTQLSMPAFERLATRARAAGYDLQALYQIGVMEFRDANRNLFNCLNYSVSEPGQKTFPFTKQAETYDATNPEHRALERVLTEDSLHTSWFEKLRHLPPMYDITAYLLLRDTHNDPENPAVSAPLPAFLPPPASDAAADGTDASTPAEARDATGCPWYVLTRHTATRWSVGSKTPDIKLPKDMYLPLIEAELMGAVRHGLADGLQAGKEGSHVGDAGGASAPTSTPMPDRASGSGETFVCVSFASDTSETAVQLFNGVGAAGNSKFRISMLDAPGPERRKCILESDVFVAVISPASWTERLGDLELARKHHKELVVVHPYAQRLMYILKLAPPEYRWLEDAQSIVFDCTTNGWLKATVNATFRKLSATARAQNPKSAHGQAPAQRRQTQQQQRQQRQQQRQHQRKQQRQHQRQQQRRQ